MTPTAALRTPVAALNWSPPTGRELGSEVIDDAPKAWRLVACLNVWNDLPALRQTLPTWYEHVDAVIAVDGSYPETDHPPLSTDGTREYLRTMGKVTLIDKGHASQFEKRNAYLNACRQGDLLFVVDADESVTGADALRQCPWMDVGWVRVTSPLYKHEYGQPRVFRWQPGLEYRGRHHWLYAGAHLLATHQYGGTGVEARLVPLTLQNQRGLGHSPLRQTAKRHHASAQLAIEAPQQAAPHTAMSDAHATRRESLRIAHIALIDAGMAPSRLHTALNRTTPHASLFWKGEDGPFGVAGQYHTVKDRMLMRHALTEADIVHFHVHTMSHRTKTTPRQGVVIHHHGTQLRRQPALFQKEARDRKALVLVSNLELLTYADTAHFLPNPVPVARYRRLASAGEWTGGPFRVAHSPSKPEKKGTVDFLAACERLRAAGYPVEPVVIAGVSHAEALTAKATCHACFDSFWLGMQCSGIEAAAMGMPVIAGDETVAERYRARGGVPYTFAGDGEQLEHELARLMDDPDYRRLEALRVACHVEQYHDESAVALKYLDLLDSQFGWRR